MNHSQLRKIVFSSVQRNSQLFYVMLLSYICFQSICHEYCLVATGAFQVAVSTRGWNHHSLLIEQCLYNYPILFCLLPRVKLIFLLHIYLDFEVFHVPFADNVFISWPLWLHVHFMQFLQNVFIDQSISSATDKRQLSTSCYSAIATFVLYNTV